VIYERVKSAARVASRLHKQAIEEGNLNDNIEAAFARSCVRWGTGRIGGHRPATVHFRRAHAVERRDTSFSVAQAGKYRLKHGVLALSSAFHSLERLPGEARSPRSMMGAVDQKP